MEIDEINNSLQEGIINSGQKSLQNKTRTLEVYYNKKCNVKIKKRTNKIEQTKDYAIC